MLQRLTSIFLAAIAVTAIRGGLADGAKTATIHIEAANQAGSATVSVDIGKVKFAATSLL